MSDVNSLRPVKYKTIVEGRPMNFDGQFHKWIVIDDALLGIVEDDEGICKTYSIEDIKFTDQEN